MNNFCLQNSKQVSQPFLKFEKKSVLWVINHKVEIHVFKQWMGFEKILYIYVGDLAQKWEKNDISF